MNLLFDYKEILLYTSLIPLIGILLLIFTIKEQKKLMQVTGFPKVSTATFFNNLTTIGSFTILPPKKLGEN